MRTKINNIVSVCFSFIKFTIIKCFYWKALSYYFLERFSPNTVVDIAKDSHLYLGKAVRAHTGVRIKVRKGAKLRIGNNTALNYGCMIFCHNEIEIGSNVIFGPNVLVYDHDHNFRDTGIIQENGFKLEKVNIGNNVWIGANSIILRGTTIGDNSVIGAGSIIKGSISNNSVVIQKREISIINRKFR